MHSHSLKTGFVVNISKAQREAGNYKMDHRRIHGLGISIETRKGQRRRPEWPAMAADYGYIKGTMGLDGDHVDCFIGPHPESETVYVIDQPGASGDRFDEHKVLIGFRSREAAIATYKRCYKPGWRVGPVTTMTIQQFKAWLKEGNQMKPVHKQVSRYSSRLADLHLPHDPPTVDRYEWNEMAHPRQPAGSPGGIGGEFRPSNQVSSGGVAPDSTGAGRGSGSNPSQGYVKMRQFLPKAVAGRSYADENAEIAARHARVNSMPGMAKSTKLREVASAPFLVRDHELHWSKAGEYSQKIFQWHLDMNRELREMTLEHTVNASSSDRYHKFEQAWQAGDKSKIRDLLARMNAMDKEARGKGINLADFVNANGLIPQEIAERLASGSRFFDPERIRDKIKAGNKRIGRKAIQADNKAKSDRIDKMLNYSPVPESSKIPGVSFTGNKSIVPKPLPKPRHNQPAEPLAPELAASEPTALQPSSPEQLHTAIASAFDKLSKQGQRLLDSAIRTGFADDDGQELPSDMVADLRESVIDTWNQMKSEAEDFNMAYDQVIKHINNALGVGKNNLRGRLMQGTDYDKIPGFDQAAEFARNHYPHLLVGSSGESDVQGQDDHALSQAIIRGKMDVPEQPWHPQVIEEARKRIAPAIAAAGDAPTFVQDPDDPDYVPFSVQSIVEAIDRYCQEIGFSA